MPYCRRGDNSMRNKYEDPISQTDDTENLEKYQNRLFRLFLRWHLSLTLLLFKSGMKDH